jgi:hypothetical protein
MSGGVDHQRAVGEASGEIPAHFLETFTDTLARAGWTYDRTDHWQRSKKVGRAQVNERVTLHSDRSGATSTLAGTYRYSIDTNSDYGVIYDEQEPLPSVPLATADPAQLATAVLARSGGERRLLAARTAWMVGDAWPRLQELELFPGWMSPIASPRWSVRWTTVGDEWVVTTLDPNINGEHPLLRYERYRGEESDPILLASGALPLDPLTDVGGIFAAFVAMIGRPAARP